MASGEEDPTVSKGDLTVSGDTGVVDPPPTKMIRLSELEATITELIQKNMREAGIQVAALQRVRPYRWKVGVRVKKAALPLSLRTWLGLRDDRHSVECCYRKVYGR